MTSGSLAITYCGIPFPSRVRRTLFRVCHHPRAESKLAYELILSLHDLGEAVSLVDYGAGHELKRS